MNNYAQKFNMDRTSFSNPHGLTHNQNLSSVMDLAILS
jgi:D-alanyl-D-alanine carboxypeptidase